MITIRKGSLLKKQEKYGWKGKGTKGDPIIIDSISSKDTYLHLWKLDMYFVIKNLEIPEIYIRSCKNVTIENCNLVYLWLFGSHDIIVRNNSIIRLDIEFSNANVVEDNLFHEAQIERIDLARKKGKDSTRPLDILANLNFAREKIEKQAHLSDIVLAFGAIITLIISFPLLILVTEFFTFYSPALYYALALLLSPIILSINLTRRLKVRKKTKDLKSNIIINNKCNDLNFILKKYPNYAP